MAGPELEIGGAIGAYRVVARIDGDFGGDTYRAVHAESGRRVIIEVAAAEPWREAAIRMLRAASLVDAIAHPGVARVVDRGVLGTGGERRLWLASELPTGLALPELVATRPLPAAEVAALIRDAADVLAHAHRCGVVHRALGLRSIVLATGERTYPLCIVGWGQRAGDRGVYGAPEGDMGDGRVDVYALGVVAYRAATRSFPTGEGPVVEVPGAPAGLEGLIAGMLARDPALRPTAGQVRALAAALLEAGDADAAAPVPLPADDVGAVTPRLTKPRWTPAPPIGAITSERSPQASGEIVIPPAERE